MGADFIFYLVGMPIGKEPNWDLSPEEFAEAARRYQKTRGDDLPMPEVIQGLKEQVDILKTVWNGGFRRDVSLFNRGHEKLLITGGLSWGDNPTDMCSVFDDLYEAGLMDLLGFDDSHLDDGLFDKMNSLLEKVEAKGMKKEAEEIRKIFHQIGAKVLFE